MEKFSLQEEQHGDSYENREYEKKGKEIGMTQDFLNVLSVLWIRDVYPGSDFFPSPIPDPDPQRCVLC